jgi:hypothetical protein
MSGKMDYCLGHKGEENETAKRLKKKEMHSQKRMDVSF